jgi:hypothetical protein
MEDAHPFETHQTLPNLLKIHDPLATTLCVGMHTHSCAFFLTHNLLYMLNIWDILDTPL